jgi:hypothetical protein
MYSRTSLAMPVAVNGREREDSKTCPLTVPVRSRFQPPSLRPAAGRFFLESKFPNPAPANVSGLGKGSLTFVRISFTKVNQDWAGEFSIVRPSSLSLPVS